MGHLATSVSCMLNIKWAARGNATTSGSPTHTNTHKHTHTFTAVETCMCGTQMKMAVTATF